MFRAEGAVWQPIRRTLLEAVPDVWRRRIRSELLIDRVCGCFSHLDVCFGGTCRLSRLGKGWLLQKLFLACRDVAYCFAQ